MRFFAMNKIYFSLLLANDENNEISQKSLKTTIFSRRNTELVIFIIHKKKLINIAIAALLGMFLKIWVKVTNLAP